MVAGWGCSPHICCQGTFLVARWGRERWWARQARRTRGPDPSPSTPTGTGSGATPVRHLR